MESKINLLVTLTAFLSMRADGQQSRPVTHAIGRLNIPCAYTACNGWCLAFVFLGNIIYIMSVDTILDTLQSSVPTFIKIR